MKNITIRQSYDLLLIEQLRKRYLNSLSEFQEFFLEQIGQEGSFYIIERNDEIIAYVIILEEGGQIIEFYSFNKSLFINRDILKEIILNKKISSIFCKSFDTILLNAVSLLSTQFSVDGILFREYEKQNIILNDEIIEINALSSDLKMIADINDSFFEDKEEITKYIEAQSLILFKKDETLIGCGLYQPIAYDYDYFDIGMMVNPDNRQQGYGAYIVNRLISICESKGKIPICGCAYSNSNSYKTLIKAGFIPGYEILNFTISE